LLTDRTDLTGVLSWALARGGFVPVHDRGRVLADGVGSVEPLKVAVLLMLGVMPWSW
jgi:hypothetical protein